MVNPIGKAAVDAAQDVAKNTVDEMTRTGRQALADIGKDSLVTKTKARAQNVKQTFVQKIKDALCRIPLLGRLFKRIFARKGAIQSGVSVPLKPERPDRFRPVWDKNGVNLEINQTALERLKSDDELNAVIRTLRSLPQDHPAHAVGKNISGTLDAMDKRFLGKYLDQEGVIFEAFDKIEPSRFSKTVQGYKLRLNNLNGQIDSALAKLPGDAPERAPLLQASEAIKHRHNLLSNMIREGQPEIPQ